MTWVLFDPKRKKVYVIQNTFVDVEQIDFP